MELTSGNPVGQTMANVKEAGLRESDSRYLKKSSGCFTVKVSKLGAFPRVMG